MRGQSRDTNCFRLNAFPPPPCPHAGGIFTHEKQKKKVNNKSIRLLVRLGIQNPLLSYTPAHATTQPRTTVIRRVVAKTIRNLIIHRINAIGVCLIYSFFPGRTTVHVPLLSYPHWMTVPLSYPQQAGTSPGGPNNFLICLSSNILLQFVNLIVFFFYFLLIIEMLAQAQDVLYVERATWIGHPPVYGFRVVLTQRRSSCNRLKSGVSQRIAIKLRSNSIQIKRSHKSVVRVS